MLCSGSSTQTHGSSAREAPRRIRAGERGGPVSRRAGAYALAAAGVVGVALFVLLGGETDEAGDYAAFRSESAGAPVRDAASLGEERTEKLRAVRDEALECMGWASGNAFRRYRWRQVESYVGQRGYYFDRFMALVPPGMPSALEDAERTENFARYQDAFVQGRRAPLDRAEIARCIERAIELNGELSALIDAADVPEDPRPPFPP